MVQTDYAAAAYTSGSSNLPNFSKISGSVLLEECKLMTIVSTLKTYILIIVIIPSPCWNEFLLIFPWFVIICADVVQELHVYYRHYVPQLLDWACIEPH